MDQGVYQILITDDEQDLCSLLSHLIDREGMHALAAHDGRSALDILQQGSVDLLIVDNRLPDMSGLELLEKTKRIYPNMPVIMITGYAEVRGAVEALKAGVEEYLAKPFGHAELIRSVLKALSARKSPAIGDGTYYGGDERKDEGGLWEKMGSSAIVGRLVESVRQVAYSEFNVLIMGETGTGKELVAQAIHQYSARIKGPFVPVDCGAIPETLLESELFGYEKGAFSGAVSRKIGKFELAANGTLFLDEISNLPLAAQAKLLRALQERRLFRIGGLQQIGIDARVVAACNQHLESIAEQGGFRSDLLFRLNEFTIRTPPLRERAEDIPYLAQRFLSMTNTELHKNVGGFSQDALDLLVNFSWPGNVRQLRNVVRQAVLLADDLVTVRHLTIHDETASVPEKSWLDSCKQSQQDLQIPMGLPLKDAVRRQTAVFEARLISDALRKCGGNKAQAARLLQIDYKTIHTKIKEYQIEEKKDG